MSDETYETASIVPGPDAVYLAMGHEYVAGDDIWTCRRCGAMSRTFTLNGEQPCPGGRADSEEADN